MMKKRLLDILVCPVCKTELQMETNEAGEEGEVITGILHCPKCFWSYPIENGIPNMLPPEN